MFNPFDTRFREAFAAKYEPEAQEHMARGYWAFLVMLFTLIVIASVAYGAWEFMRPLGESAGENLILVQPKAPLNRAELQAVIDGFDTRVRLFDERQSAPPVPDPS